MCIFRNLNSHTEEAAQLLPSPHREILWQPLEHGPTTF